MCRLLSINHDKCNVIIRGKIVGNELYLISVCVTGMNGSWRNQQQIRTEESIKLQLN